MKNEKKKKKKKVEIYSIEFSIFLCWKKKYALENETLLDRAVFGYADRLQEQFCGIPQI